MCTLHLKLMHNVHSVYIFCILCTLCTKQMSYKMLCTFVGTHLQFDIILCTLELVCTCTLSVLVTLTPQKCLKMFKNDQKCSQECTSELSSKKQRSRVHTVHTMHF